MSRTDENGGSQEAAKSLTPASTEPPPSASAAPSRLIITVHGIRTYGGWQERLEVLLDEHVPPGSIEYRHFKYGFFSSIEYAFPPVRWLRRLWFQRVLREKFAERKWDRVDIISHSFGAHLVGHTLLKLVRKHELTVQISTLIFAGSVLKHNFPIEELLGKGALRVVNECGQRDSVLVINQLLVFLSGAAGRFGFSGAFGKKFRNRFYPFGHSGYFAANVALGYASRDSFMRTQWLPLLLGEGEVPASPIESPKAIRGALDWTFRHMEPLKLTLLVSPLIAIIAVLFVQRELARKAQIEASRAEANEKQARYDEHVQADAARASAQRAEQRTREAEASALEARQNRFLSQFALAYRSFQAGDFATARASLLECEADFRRWEWHWLYNRIIGGINTLKVDEPIVDIAIASADTAYATTLTRLIELNLGNMTVVREQNLPVNSGSALTSKYISRLPEQSERQPLDQMWVAELNGSPLKWRQIMFGHPIRSLSRPNARHCLATLGVATGEGSALETNCETWSMQTGERVRNSIIAVDESSPPTIDLSPDGDRLIAVPPRGGSGSFAGSLAVYDLGRRDALEGPTVDRAVWLDANNILFAEDNRTFRASAVLSKRKIGAHEPVSDFFSNIKTLRRAGDGRQVLATDGNSLKAWDVPLVNTEEANASLNQFVAFGGTEQGVTAADSLARLSFTNDGIMSTYLIGYESGVLQRVDAPNAYLSYNVVFPVPIVTGYFVGFNGSTNRPALLEFDSPERPDSATLMEAGDLWRLGRAVEQGLLEVTPAFPWLLSIKGTPGMFPEQQIRAWRPDKHLAIVDRTPEDDDESCELVDTKTGRRVSWMANYSTEGWRLDCLSTDGRIAGFSHGASIVLIDTTSGGEIGSFALQSGAPGVILALSNDGIFAVLRREREDELWKLTPQPHSITGFHKRYYSYAFSYDGQRVICGARDLALFDTRTGTELVNIASFGATPTEEKLGFDTVAISSDSTTILGAGVRYKPTELFCAGNPLFEQPTARDLLDDGEPETRLRRTMYKRRRGEVRMLQSESTHIAFTSEKGSKGFFGVIFESRASGAVAGVVANTPADYAGMKKGDIVLSVNNRPTASGEEAVLALHAIAPGSVVKYGIKRGNSTGDLWGIMAREGDSLEDAYNPVTYATFLERAAQTAFLVGRRADALGLSSAAKEVFTVLLKARPSDPAWHKHVDTIEAGIAKCQE